MNARTTRNHNKKLGFTIVELLIVIVVIGILAAITIVSFNGVANKARIASLQSALESAGKQIEIARTTGGTDVYPATVANLPTGVTYVATPTLGGFCSSKSDNGITYMTTGANPISHVGPGCTLTNLIANPSFETNLNSWMVGQRATITRQTAPAEVSVGTAALRLTRASTTSGEGYTALQIATTVGKKYSLSFAMRNLTGTPTINASVNNFNQGWNTVGGTTSSLQVIPSSTYTRYTLSWTAEDTTTILVIENLSNTAATTATDIDAVIATEGDNSATYVDPSTRSDWAWDGTTALSTSHGPAF